MNLELPGTSVHAILLERKGVLQAYAVKKPKTKPKMKCEQKQNLKKKWLVSYIIKQYKGMET